MLLTYLLTYLLPKGKGDEGKQEMRGGGKERRKERGIAAIVRG